MGSHGGLVGRGAPENSDPGAPLIVNVGGRCRGVVPVAGEAGDEGARANSASSFGSTLTPLGSTHCRKLIIPRSSRGCGVIWWRAFLAVAPSDQKRNFHTSRCNPSRSERGLVSHEDCLLFDRLRRHEAHRAPLHGLTIASASSESLSPRSRSSPGSTAASASSHRPSGSSAVSGVSPSASRSCADGRLEVSAKPGCT
jgi:hypothetical protein